MPRNGVETPLPDTVSKHSEDNDDEVTVPSFVARDSARGSARYSFEGRGGKGERALAGQSLFRIYTDVFFRLRMSLLACQAAALGFGALMALIATEAYSFSRSRLDPNDYSDASFVWSAVGPLILVSLAVLINCALRVLNDFSMSDMDNRHLIFPWK